MAKVKIIKPVIIRGKLHHMAGSIVEATDAEAKLITGKGWGEKAADNATVDKGATIDASQVAKEKEAAAEK
jgi:hypothetical protein